MGEVLDVLRALEQAHDRGEPYALATVVQARGSTYRREGARLLVREEGQRSVGNISGGCLEGDVEETAREVMRSGQPRLRTFDLTADDEAVWGWGLGCNGVIEVLIEPGEHAAATAAAVRTALEHEEALAAVVVLESGVADVAVGDRLLVRPDGSVDGRLGDEGAQAAAVTAANAALEARRSITTTLRIRDARLRLFVEVLEPPIRLVVCGAGHDAIPLVEFAHRLGWRVAVVDERHAFLTADRFPGADRLVHVDRPLQAAANAGTDARTHVVVMSHNYLRDMDYLQAFLDTPVASIGMLGPQARLERLLGDLATQEVVPADEHRAKIRGPAGLDIGGEGPEEIAWSIVAEILALHRGRSGGFLQDRPGPIHEPTPTGG